jgi:alcohol dehydrogenase class IV
MSKMDKVRQFQVKPKIWYGIGSVAKLGQQGYQKVCIVTDEGMVKFGLLKMVTDVLEAAGIEYHVFPDVKPDPSTDIVEKGLTHILMDRPDVLIALGGGSSIDTAKGIIYYTYHFKAMFTDREYIVKPQFIAIPTTAGTGSEVTEYAVITDQKTGTKIPLTDDIMMPDAAILDPKLIESVPAGATAATGLDVLTHAVESYVSTGNNPFSRCYAAKACELVFKSLLPSYENGHDLDSKASMQIASSMAGIAFNSSGLGMAHAIAHGVGAQYHLPHGLACAMVLPYVVAFNGKDERAEYLYKRLLESVGEPQDAGASAAATLVRLIFELCGKLGIPTCLKASKADTDNFAEVRDKLIDRAMADATLATNPVQPTRDEMGAVVDMVYAGIGCR